MKKFSTLITALILSFSVFAFSPQSMLSVSSNTKYPVSVSIDNRNCADKNSDDIVMKDVNAGYHSIKVYRDKMPYDKRSQFNSKKQLIYSGNVYVRPGFHVDVTINRFGKAFIDEKKINASYDDDSNDWNDHYDHKEPMSEVEFGEFKQTICNNSFDNTKLAVATQAIGCNYFTAAQVKDMIELFSFENNKLGLAKSAYRSCIDKHNYYVVSNALCFESSKQELAKFLETSK
ncbi:MAG: DUF4476 domain-containing protein [Ferruginibacter sp.]